MLILTIVLTAACSDLSPPPPPAPLRSAIPGPPGGHDYARQPFAFPLSVTNSEDILTRTENFEFGTMPPKRQVQAFNVLLDEPEALSRFERVARRGRLAGKLYAFCGFRLLNGNQQTTLASALTREADKVLVIEHDVIRGSMAVSEILTLIEQQHVCDLMRSDKGRTAQYFEEEADRRSRAQ